MVDTDSTKPWASLGISKSWYYAIKAETRVPSLRIAIALYDLEEIKAGPISGLSAKEIEILRKTLPPHGQEVVVKQQPAQNTHTPNSVRDSHQRAESTSTANEREGMAAR